MLQAGFQTALRVIYPPRCLACGGLVEQDNGLCAACFAETPFISGLTCTLCGIPLPGASANAETCDDCLKLGRPWRCGTAPLRYEGVARRLVLGLKHGDRHEIVDTAADWMLQKLPRNVDPDTVVVPVPLHLTRLLKRRYNQSALLAHAIARRRGFAYLPDALIRHNRTPPLDGKTREERFQAMQNVISAHPKRGARLTEKSVLIVDDVMTSGATLAACALACHDAGARDICVAVMARVAKAA